MSGLLAIGGWAAVSLYAVLTAALHLELSLWLVTPVDSGRWAGLKPAQALGPLWWLLGAGLLLYLGHKAWRGTDRSRTGHDMARIMNRRRPGNPPALTATPSC